MNLAPQCLHSHVIFSCRRMRLNVGVPMSSMSWYWCPRMIMWSPPHAMQFLGRLSLSETTLYSTFGRGKGGLTFIIMYSALANLTLSVEQHFNAKRLRVKSWSSSPRQKSSNEELVINLNYHLKTNLGEIPHDRICFWHANSQN